MPVTIYFQLQVKLILLMWNSKVKWEEKILNWLTFCLTSLSLQNLRHQPQHTSKWFPTLPQFIKSSEIQRDPVSVLRLAHCYPTIQFVVPHSWHQAPWKLAHLLWGIGGKGKIFFHTFSSPRYFLHSCKQNVIGFRHLLKSSVCEYFTISSQFKVPFLGCFFPHLQTFI